MIGESADYDGWRIESMELACHYDELEGAALDVYRLGWRLHTTTPDKVILAGPEDPYPTLPEGREPLTLGRWTDPRIPAGNGWYYLPVSDFTWYPRSQFWADYQEVLTWLTSRAVFTLYWQKRKYAAPTRTFGPGGGGVFVSGAFIPRCRPPGSSPRRSPGRRAGPGRGRRTGR